MEKDFNPEIEVKNITSFIKKYYQKNNLKGVVIGISGGKDSGVVAALFAKAIGSENVIGLTLPCHSKEEDKKDALLISNYYNFEMYDFDLTPTYDSFKTTIKKQFNKLNNQTINSDINLKPRLRMSALYYYAALMSELKGGTYLVAGTSNKCELYVGYFTKGGDNVHDISVLANYTVDEVIKIGEYLNVPQQALYKTPSDGIQDKSDEERLGITYKQIKDYINKKPLEKDVIKQIRKLHLSSRHKFNIPTYKIK